MGSFSPVVAASIVFIMAFGYMTSNTPTYLIPTSVGTPQAVAPEFDANKLLGSYTVMNCTMSRTDSIFVHNCKFDDENCFHSDWNYDGVEIWKHDSSPLNLWRLVYSPSLTEGRLVADYKASVNGTIVSLASSEDMIKVLIRDTNSTRNDLSAAYAEGEFLVFVTVYNGSVAYDGSTNDLRTGVTIMMSVLTYKLPELFDGMFPTVAWLISTIFWLLTISSVIYLLSAVVHGV